MRPGARARHIARGEPAHTDPLSPVSPNPMSGGARAVPTITPQPLPRRDFLARAAARVLEAHGAGQLRDAVVIVPDLHAVADVALALRRAAGASCLLLPRITTLRAWAQQVPLDRPVLGSAARDAMLYRALSRHDWFDPADLWNVCAELGRLFDELTRERVSLPRDAAGFADFLKQAYGGGEGPSLDFEARLVRDTWTAYTAEGATLDRETAYIAQLAILAGTAAAPVHLIGCHRWSRAESEFLAAYAARAPLTMYLPSEDARDGAAALVATAWTPMPAPPLKERARTVSSIPGSPLAQRFRIAAASSPEHEAQIVDCAVRERLIAGKERIAVVVQDRITARRARALLERAGVLVSDEAGWAISTTSAATVLARWLDAVTGNFYHRDLLDLLKSPFVFADWPRQQRQHAVWRLEASVRRANVIAGLERYVALMEADAEARRMLITLRSAAEPLQRRRATLAQWLEILLASLDAIGVVHGWTQDAAGQQVLELLTGLREELRGDDLVVTGGVWRQWLASALDNASFRDLSVKSPVVFTYLEAMPLRAFDAVIIAGVDAQHLPGPDSAGLFFNQRVRAQLGLATRETACRDAEAALASIIETCDDVVATWQCVVEGEPNLLSAPIERLEALHAAAYGHTLHDALLAGRAPLAAVQVDTDLVPRPVARPAPRVPAALAPRGVSASAHNTLMACPYQYYARHVLRLAEVDEVQELIEKSDYGRCVHEALATFHKAHPLVGALDTETALRELERCTDAAFARAVETNYLARGWLERWRALLPAYLDWQRDREAAGWRVAASEVDRTRLISTPAGGQVELRGRIDRVDCNEGGEIALIDYKTQALKRVRTRAQADGEDVQLPFYALLWDGIVADALFVALERDGLGAQPYGADVNESAAAVRSRLVALCDAVREGAPLPAHGIDEACRYCEVAGLCRKDHWT